MLTYLRLADKRLCLLINFGERQMKDGFTRIANFTSLGVYHAEHRKGSQRKALPKLTQFTYERNRHDHR